MRGVLGLRTAARLVAVVRPVCTARRTRPTAPTPWSPTWLRTAPSRPVFRCGRGICWTSDKRQRSRTADRTGPVRVRSIECACLPLREPERGHSIGSRGGVNPFAPVGRRVRTGTAGPSTTSDSPRRASRVVVPLSAPDYRTGSTALSGASASDGSVSGCSPGRWRTGCGTAPRTARRRPAVRRGCRVRRSGRPRRRGSGRRPARWTAGGR